MAVIYSDTAERAYSIKDIAKLLGKKNSAEYDLGNRRIRIILSKDRKSTDGSVIWTDDTGLAWSGVGHANGVVYSGSNTFPDVLTANNAVNGKRLHQIQLPNNTVSVATVDGNNLYVGYGIFGTNGGEVPPG